MEIFEIAVRRQAKESQDAIELRARITSSQSVEEAINALDAIIYTHLGVQVTSTPREVMANTYHAAELANQRDTVAVSESTPREVMANTYHAAELANQRDTVAVSESTEEEVEATKPATQDLPPVKAKRKYSKRVTLAEVAVESQPITDAVVQEVAEINDLLVAEPVSEPVVTPAPAPVIDFDLLSMDDEPAPQPAVVNVAKLKVPEVKYEEPKTVAPAANASAPEVTDPLKLQKRIQDAIASRVISPEPVLSLMHDRGFNSTRETDEACRIAILELIIAAEAKK